MPENSELNCSNILGTKPIISADRKVFAASPGSGNNLVRWDEMGSVSQISIYCFRLMIEISTGYTTCLEYKNKRHEDAGYLLVFSHHLDMDFMVSPEESIEERCPHLFLITLILHHSMLRFENLVYYHGKGILMIRNPFKAILSYFRHSVFGFHSNSEYTLKNYKLKAKENIGVFYTPLFEKYAYNAIRKWRALVEDWVTVGEVLVVHYEEIIEDKKAEVERIIKHLDIEIDTRRVKCLVYTDLDLFKRRASKMTHSPYSRPLADFILDNIRVVDKLLVKMGHKGIPYEKYGMKRCFESLNVSYGE